MNNHTNTALGMFALIRYSTKIVKKKSTLSDYLFIFHNNFDSFENLLLHIYFAYTTVQKVIDQIMNLSCFKV